MELRLSFARTTRDIDLALRPNSLRKGGWEENAAAILESLLAFSITPIMLRADPETDT